MTGRTKTATGEVTTFTWDFRNRLTEVLIKTSGGTTVQGGSVVDSITYDTFGNIIAEAHPTSGDRFKYTSREWDSEIGQYFYRARYYSPTDGRFESEDPIGLKAGDSDLYRYVVNRPTAANDPGGTCMVDNKGKVICPKAVKPAGGGLGWSWTACYGAAISGGAVGAGVGAVAGAPAFGIGAGLGALAGGVAGAVIGCVGSGLYSGTAHPNDSPGAQLGTGLLLGIPAGVAGGYAGPGLLAWGTGTGIYAPKPGVVGKLPQPGSLEEAIQMRDSFDAIMRTATRRLPPDPDLWGFGLDGYYYWSVQVAKLLAKVPKV